VYHKPEENYSPLSIIILDSNFTIIDEVKLDKEKYSAYGFVCEDGLLISNYYETLHDKDHFKKNTFSLFRYE